MRLLWAVLCAFIVYGSLGTWAFYQPGIWAPTLVVVSDVALNIALYIPFGILGFLSLREGYLRARSKSGGANLRMRLVMRVVLLALLFSASNEAFQLYTIDRVASLTDIVSAAIGALAGGVAIALWLEPK